jgi:hypothetical protein
MATASTPDELGDLRRLITLRATMGQPQVGAKATVEELRFLAHRMCGASAIFGCPALAAGAHAFIEELSARGGLEAADSRSSTFLTLDVLIDLLFSMDDQTRPQS